MSATRKREGFKGQRAIVIPAKILAKHFDNHPIVKQLYVTDIGYYPNALYHYRKRIHGVNQYILIYCVKGNGWAIIADKKYNMSAGDFILLPATPRMNTVQMNKLHGLYTGCILKEQTVRTLLI